MSKSLLDRLVERPHGRADTVTWFVLYLLVIVLMANLGALVDKVFHPEIPYLDEEHLFVGAATAVTTSILFGAMIFYSVRLNKERSRLQAAECSRSASEERYRSLFRDSHDPVFIMDSEGDFIDINPAGARVLGINAPEGVVRLNIERDLDADRESLSGFYAESEKAGFVEDFRLPLRNQRGEPLVMSVTASVVRDGNGAVVAYRGIMRDVTDKDYLDRQVMNAQRMESVGQLARGIAHQFNNVITTIQGYAALAAGDVPEGGRAAEALGQIQVSATRAERLTRELMVFSRKDQVNPRPLGVNRLIESSRDLFSHVAGEDIILTTILYADAAVASIDAASMENALFNLVLFSRERMRGHGEIKVISGRTEIGGSDVHDHPEAGQGSYVTLTVEDNGPLITPEESKRIFEPFAGASGGQEAGMEMSVVHGIVMNHDGWVEIDSTAARTRFTIYLPALEANADAGEEEAAEVQDLQGRGQKVLLVEDEDAVRSMAETTLANNGYVVLPARDASEAFLIFAREKGEIDVIFSDVVMPGESGVSLADHLIEYNARMPVILTSGLEATVDDWRSIEEHGYRFLPKPYRLEDLLREMRGVFGGN
ncbi:MAG: response regulator [Gaiellales bacterium]|nr:MAG: response regulator [Gaiellales bacterium]